MFQSSMKVFQFFNNFPYIIYSLPSRKTEELILLQSLCSRHCDRSCRYYTLSHHLTFGTAQQPFTLKGNVKFRKSINSLAQIIKILLKCIPWSGFKFFLRNIFCLGSFVSCLSNECKFLVQGHYLISPCFIQDVYLAPSQQVAELFKDNVFT